MKDPTDKKEPKQPTVAWYMDNGGREKSKLGMHLDVSTFNDVEREFIKEAISQKFDIDITYHRRAGNNVK